MPGAFIGTRLLVRLGNRAVRGFFMVVLTVLGIEMIVRGITGGAMARSGLATPFFIFLVALASGSVAWRYGRSHNVQSGGVWVKKHSGLVVALLALAAFALGALAVYVLIELGV